MNRERRISPIVCYLWIWKLVSNHFQTSEPPELRTGNLFSHHSKLIELMIYIKDGFIIRLKVATRGLGWVRERILGRRNCLIERPGGKLTQYCIVVGLK